jgi:hypothetical protein
MTSAEERLIETVLAYWRAKKDRAMASSVTTTALMRAAEAVIRERMMPKTEVTR